MLTLEAEARGEEDSLEIAPGALASAGGDEQMQIAKRAARVILVEHHFAKRVVVAVSHAPGLSGMPVRGHVSSASTSASCAISSASPTSRSIRARLPMIFADSILQTASMVR